MVENQGYYTLTSPRTVVRENTKTPHEDKPVPFFNISQPLRLYALPSKIIMMLLLGHALLACSTADRALRSVDNSHPVLPLPANRNAANAEPMPVELIHLDRTAAMPSTAPQQETAYQLPYEPIILIGRYHDMRPGGRVHMGLDFAGEGEHYGIGAPIFAIGRSVVLAVGDSQTDPARYGRAHTGHGTVSRGGRRLPRSAHIPGYGRVYFFTRNYGTWHTGTIVTTRLLEGPLSGHRVRYMHLGAYHPDLTPGTIVERGQEIGLMGGTAVQRDRPHLHMDVEDENGERVDPSIYLGINDSGEPLTPYQGPDC